MKILITTDWYNPVINGVVTSVNNLSRELSKMGHEVRILTLSHSIRSHRDDNVYSVRSVSAGIIYPEARFTLAKHSHLVKELIDWDPDIIHSQCEFFSFYLAREIANSTGCPVVHTYHTVYEEYAHYFFPHFERIGRGVAGRFSRFTLTKTDHIIVPTAKAEDILIKYGVTSPVTVIPTGLDMSKFDIDADYERSRIRNDLGIGENDVVMLFLGRVAKEKNLDELIDYFSRIKNENVKFMIVGHGPYMDDVRKSISSLGLDDRTYIIGRVPPDRVPAYYAAGDIFVNASTSETQGLTYIEAMASGLPMLCRDDKCLEGLISDGKNGFRYTNIAEFDNDLNKLISDAGLRANLGGNASRLAHDNYSMEAFANRVESVYLATLH